jgi:hypothetical protein
VKDKVKALSGKNGGFLQMVLAVLGVVLYVTMFANILAGFVSLLEVANIGEYIAFETVVKIAPTILFLIGIFGAGALYYHGYKQATGAGINSMLLIVFGALQIILFVTLFSTIMTAMESLRTHANVTAFIAFQTVVEIAPTILLLMGLFSGGAVAVSGWRKSKNKASPQLA